MRGEWIRDCMLDWAYPRDCLECAAPVESGSRFRFLCTECDLRDLVRAMPPSCPVCGHPWYGKVEEEPVCSHCRELEAHFGEGRTLLLLRRAGRSWVHGIKYHQGSHLLPDLAVLFSEREDLPAYFRDRILVPVPLHPRKLRERGFNQSLWIARQIAHFAPTAEVHPLLIRVKDTPTQTLLSREERIRNLKYAFALRKKYLVSSKKSYLIIDDVFTTGATLNACAKILKQAGAQRVDVFTLGHG